MKECIVATLLKYPGNLRAVPSGLEHGVGVASHSHIYQATHRHFAVREALTVGTSILVECNRGRIMIVQF